MRKSIGNEERIILKTTKAISIPKRLGICIEINHVSFYLQNQAVLIIQLTLHDLIKT